MIESLMDRSPCEGCPAAKIMWSMERCMELGACWITEPDLLSQVLEQSGASVMDLHDPPVFAVKKDNCRSGDSMLDFTTEQKLSSTGRIVKKLYEVVICSARRSRLQKIGVVQDEKS